MQLLPSTAADMARQLHETYDGKRLLNDPAYNTRLGTQYLRELLDQYAGNSFLALSAYHAGAGNTNKWISQFGDPRDGSISYADWARSVGVRNPASGRYMGDVSRAMHMGAGKGGDPLEAFGDADDRMRREEEAWAERMADLQEKAVQQTMADIEAGATKKNSVSFIEQQKEAYRSTFQKWADNELKKELAKLQSDPSSRYHQGDIGKLMTAKRAELDAQLAKKMGDFDRVAENAQLRIDGIIAKGNVARATGQIDLLTKALTGRESGDQLGSALSQVSSLQDQIDANTTKAFWADGKYDRKDPAAQAALAEARNAAQLKSAGSVGTLLDAYLKAGGRNDAASLKLAGAPLKAMSGEYGGQYTDTERFNAKQAEQDAQRLQVSAALARAERVLAIATTDRTKAATDAEAAQTALTTALVTADPKLIEAAQKELTQRQALLGTKDAYLEKAKAATEAAQAAAEAAGAPRTGGPSLTESLAGAGSRMLDDLKKLPPVASQIGDAVYGTFKHLQTGIADSLVAVATGTKSIKDAVGDMAKSILTDMLNLAAKLAAEKILMSVLGLFNIGGAPTSLVGLGGFGQTGPGRSGGGMVGGSAIGTRDSVLTPLEPGEFVMKRSAVDTIGADTLAQINAQGSSHTSRAAAPAAAALASQKREPDHVNVWLVPRDQVPPPGPKDIVQIIGDNINQRGSLRTLIKNVQMGVA